MAERRDICVGRKYTDRNGNEKTSWTKIGSLFLRHENGELKISGILEASPIGNGSFAAFVPKESDQKYTAKLDNHSQGSANADDAIIIADVPF